MKIVKLLVLGSLTGSIFLASLMGWTEYKDLRSRDRSVSNEEEGEVSSSIATECEQGAQCAAPSQSKVEFSEGGIAATEEEGGLTQFFIDSVAAVTPEVLIDKGLSSLMGYSRHDLIGIRDKKEFAKKVVEKALMRDIDEAQSQVDIDEQPIIFTNTGKLDQAPEEIDNGMVQEPFQISAHFDASNYGNRNVLARWVNVDTGMLVDMQKQSIRPYVATYVWLRREHWEPGLYRVEIFQEDTDLTVLASGQFTVLQPSMAQMGIFSPN